MSELLKGEKCYTGKEFIRRYNIGNNNIKFIDKDLSLTTVENSYVLPPVLIGNIMEFFRGGIVDETGNIVPSSKMNPDRITLPYEFDKREVKYDDREVIYIGSFWDQWGHFILEQVSRLYYILQNDSNLPIIYAKDGPFTNTYLEFFELLGIDTKRLVCVDKVTRFRKIHIPEASIVPKRYYTKEYKYIFDVIKSKVKPDTRYEKVFMTTKKVGWSYLKDLGEIDEIENFFKENGYEIVSPQDKTLKEQIAMYKGCKVLASVSGSLPHNIVFTDKNTHMIIINKTIHRNENQIILDQMLENKCTYIDAYLTLLPTHIGCGPFFFYVSKYLKEFAKDNDMKMSYKCNNKNLTKKLYVFIIKRVYSNKFYYAKYTIPLKKLFEEFKNIDGCYLPKALLIIENAILSMISIKFYISTLLSILRFKIFGY